MVPSNGYHLIKHGCKLIVGVQNRFISFFGEDQFFQSGVVWTNQLIVLKSNLMLYA